MTMICYDIILEPAVLCADSRAPQQGVRLHSQPRLRRVVSLPQTMEGMLQLGSAI